MALFDKQKFIKFPVKFLEMSADMTDAEVGQVVDAIFRYCFDESVIPAFEGRQMDAWLFLKHHADMQEAHPRWRCGGFDGSQRDRNTIEYREWRQAVFDRDGYTCQMCGQRGGTLNAHHIKRWSKFPELRFAVDNGMTLCKQCHKEMHWG